MYKPKPFVISVKIGQSVIVYEMFHQKGKNDCTSISFNGKVVKSSFYPKNNLSSIKMDAIQEIQELVFYELRHLLSQVKENK